MSEKLLNTLYLVSKNYFIYFLNKYFLLKRKKLLNWIRRKCNFQHLPTLLRSIVFYNSYKEAEKFLKSFYSSSKEETILINIF